MTPKMRVFPLFLLKTLEKRGAFQKDTHLGEILANPMLAQEAAAGPMKGVLAGRSESSCPFES